MKKIVALITVFATMAVFVSCGRNDKNNQTVTETTVEITTEKTVEEETMVEETIIEETTLEELTTTEKVEATVDNVVVMGKNPNRNRLSAKEKNLYDEIYKCITNYEEFHMDPINGEYTETNFDNANRALYEDHAELWLFMHVQNTYAPEEEGGHAIHMSIVPRYKWLMIDEFYAEYMESQMRQINDVCDEIINRMPKDVSLKEKYEFLGREICELTVYVDRDDDYPYFLIDNSYCYMNGPFLDGEGLCQAYAQAYQYLCNRAGLWCICTYGGDHAWNMVMLEDGSTYHVDLTWADSENNFEKYFLLTQEEIETDGHTHEDNVWRATGK